MKNKYYMIIKHRCDVCGGTDMKHIIDDKFLCVDCKCSHTYYTMEKRFTNNFELVQQNKDEYILGKPNRVDNMYCINYGDILLIKNENGLEKIKVTKQLCRGIQKFIKNNLIIDVISKDKIEV